MTISSAGLEHLKSFDGLELKAYQLFFCLVK